jgi:hypothetical protein
VHARVGAGVADGRRERSGVGDVAAHDRDVAEDRGEPVKSRCGADGGHDVVAAGDREADDRGADEAARTGHEQARGDAHDLLIGSLDE